MDLLVINDLPVKFLENILFESMRDSPSSIFTLSLTCSYFRRLTPSIKLELSIIHDIIKYNNTDLCSFYMSLGFPKEVIGRYAVSNGHLEILKWSGKRDTLGPNEFASKL